MAYFLNKTGVQVDRMLDPSRISLYLPSDHTQGLTLAETWYKLEAPIVDGDALDFTPRGTPNFDILFIGLDSSEIMFIGTADILLSGASATIQFGLFVDDVLVSKFTSEVTILADVDVVGLNTNGTLTVDNNQALDIRAKCSAAGRTLTIRNLKVTFKLVTA